MKNNLLKSILVVILLTMCLSGKAQPAIVELFTSEGCSSCPSAEKMMRDVTENARDDGSKIIGLAFHVTYWNRLGWKDVYSQEKFTDRQKAYAQHFNLSSIYTPQMVFNGEKEFVGSNRKAFQNALEAAHQPDYAITAEASLMEDKIKISYSLDKNEGNDILNAVWIDHNVTNHILRGENQGLTLRHMNVVRDFNQSPLKQKGEVWLTLPKDSQAEKGSVVLYIQDGTTMKIVGAKEINLQRT